MPVPTTFADLSTTIGSNSPAGSDNVFPSLDDYLRALSGFIASISANSGNGWTSPYLTTASPSYTGTLTGGTGVVNLGSGQVYKDASGNVSIGTTTPAAKFDVYGGAGGTDTRIYVRNANTTAFMGVDTSDQPFFGTAQAKAIYFLTAGASRLRIDASGNVVKTLQTSAPTLNNTEMVFALTSNTNLQISVKGSDGTTRTANITLA